MWFSKKNLDGAQLRLVQPRRTITPIPGISQGSTAGQSWLVLLASIVLALALGIYIGPYVQNTWLTRTPDELVALIARHVVVPNEKPTIATVTDPGLLSTQPFFANAHKGDKVLVFPTSKKAILYRPSIDMVIEMMPYLVDTSIPEISK